MAGLWNISSVRLAVYIVAAGLAIVIALNVVVWVVWVAMANPLCPIGGNVLC